MKVPFSQFFTKLHSFFFKKNVGTIEVIEDLKNEVRNATTESHRSDLLINLFNQGFRKEAIELGIEFGFKPIVTICINEEVRT